LDELTRVSDRFNRFYGDGNLDLAAEFARDFWAGHARLDDIAAQCPQGFAPFQRNMANAFRRARAAAGYFYR